MITRPGGGGMAHRWWALGLRSLERPLCSGLAAIAANGGIG
jgi:hypothetical protein